MLELHRRLAAAEEKRDNLKNEMNNRLEPQEEREKLLLQVKPANILTYSSNFIEIFVNNCE